MRLSPGVVHYTVFLIFLSRVIYIYSYTHTRAREHDIVDYGLVRGTSKSLNNETQTLRAALHICERAGELYRDRRPKT